jgi:hypothetical protein
VLYHDYYSITAAFVAKPDVITGLATVPSTLIYHLGAM